MVYIKKKKIWKFNSTSYPQDIQPTLTFVYLMRGESVLLVSVQKIASFIMFV